MSVAASDPEGEPALRARIAANPADAAAHLALAQSLLAARRTEEALAAFTMARLLAPTPEAARGEIACLHALTRHAEALALLDAAAAILPAPERCALAHALRHAHAVALAQSGNLAEGRAMLERLVAEAPADAAAILNLASLLMHDGEVPRALALLVPLAAAPPALAPSDLARLAAMLGEGGALQAAEAAARHAAAADPDHAGNWTVLGNALHNQARLDEAMDAYLRALALQPHHIGARCSAAMVRLAQGDLRAGFAGFEWRRARNGAPPPPLPPPASLAARRVLLTGEQGLGDTIQFARYAPLLADLGAEVALHVPPPLARLFRSLRGAPAIVPDTEPPPGADAVLPLASLPHLFGTTLATIPAETPYLAALPAEVAQWRARLAPLPGRRVGLVWSGDPRAAPSTRAAHARRSIPLAALAPLAAIPGLSLVSLQKGPGAAQPAPPPPGMTLHDWTADLHDMADTAALMTALDLVISIDTGPLHLAGALDRPVWLLNRHDSCWRWLLERTDSPWYPTLRQFRQATPGDWTGVVASVAAALAGQAP